MTQRRMSMLAATVLAHSPLQVVARRTAQDKLCVLAYHGVSDADRFARQLDWLVANTNPVSLEQVQSAVLHGKRLPPRAVLLTFDDGERSVLERAAPLLRSRRVPAVAFVVAGLVDTDTPFWWTEVEQLVAAGAAAPGRSPNGDLVRELKGVPDVERRTAIAALRAQVETTVGVPQLSSDELLALEADGIAIGNHSLSHPCLDTCDEATIRREVHESQERLTAIIGHPPSAFAYPNGNWDSRVRAEVSAAGYSVAFAFDHRLATLPVEDRLRIARVRVDTAADLDRFRILVSGLHSSIHRLRGLA